MPTVLDIDQSGGANFANKHLRNVASEHIGGASLATAALEVTGDIAQNGNLNASGGVAIGDKRESTLTAIANDDALVLIDLDPTFTPGAFTGVQQIALRVQDGLIVVSPDGIQFSDGTVQVSGGTGPWAIEILT